MEPTQPAANEMTMDPNVAKVPSKQEEEVKRLRGGGICTDCLAYHSPNPCSGLANSLVLSCVVGLQTSWLSAAATARLCAISVRPRSPDLAVTLFQFGTVLTCLGDKFHLIWVDSFLN